MESLAQTDYLVPDVTQALFLDKSLARKQWTLYIVRDVYVSDAPSKLI